MAIQGLALPITRRITCWYSNEKSVFLVFLLYW